MKLNIIKNTRHKNTARPFYEKDLRDGCCHVVTFAEDGFSMFKAWLEFIYGFSVKEGVMLCAKINEADETGTIWPKGPLTAIPRRFCREGLTKDGDLEALERALADALKANTMHSKCYKMVFDFTCAVSNEERIEAALEKLVKSAEFSSEDVEVTLLFD